MSLVRIQLGEPNFPTLRLQMAGYSPVYD
jgi:hypothetical protein